MLALLLLAVTLLPSPSGVAEDAVDVCEANTFAVWNGDEWNPKPQGQIQFTQIILWSGGEVRDWRLDKGQIWIDADRLTFTDGNAVRVVRFKQFKRTLTDFDPELADRANVDPSKRVKIGGAR